MSFDWIVYWLTVAYCALFLVNLGQHRFAQGLGWCVKCVLVLGVAAIAYGRQSETLQEVTAGLWALFIAAPTLLARLTANDAMHARYDRAWRAMQLAYLLHPFDGWRLSRQILAALALAKRGGIERAKAKLVALRDDPRTKAREAPFIQVHLCRLEQDWEALAGLEDGAHVGHSPLLQSVRLRALGEVGRLHDMVALAAPSRLGGGGFSLLDRLYVLAFCGRDAAVARLLPLLPLDAETKEYWLATAELASERDQGLMRLNRIAHSRNAIIASAVKRRLAEPLASPRDRLAAADWQSIAAIEAGLTGDAASIGRPHARLFRGLLRSYVVLGLIVVNLAVFVLELAQGGSQSDETLMRLGALSSSSVFDDGEWWRLAASAFLHFGVLHLLLNMFALAVIGISVEQALGRWRTLFIYVAAGLGSATFVVQTLPPDAVMVGASGAIFGLVGALVALLVRSWRRRSPQAGRGLLNLGLVILLQVASDFATPEVSGSAHAAGFVIGLAAAALVMSGRRQPRGA
jgi:rhomboid protease GluP